MLKVEEKLLTNNPIRKVSQKLSLDNNSYHGVLRRKRQTKNVAAPLYQSIRNYIDEL